MNLKQHSVEAGEPEQTLPIGEITHAGVDQCDIDLQETTSAPDTIIAREKDENQPRMRSESAHTPWLPGRGKAAASARQRRGVNTGVTMATVTMQDLDSESGEWPNRL